MFELEPGPLERLTVDLLEPFPSRPSFEGLLADAREQLRAHDPALTGAAIGVGDNPTDGIDASYNTTIGGAEAHVNGEIASSPSSPTAVLIENGDNTDNIRRSVLRYLPNPDFPIGLSLTEPPPIPDAENPFPTPPPRGGDDADTPT